MNFFQTIKSILAAALGVRSQHDAENDFKKIDWRWYVALGGIFVFILIGLLALVVKTILH